jgi:tetratricopeptide (TPR) repeat protein
MQLKYLFFLCLFCIANSVFGQTEPEQTMIFLSDEDVQEANMEQDEFLVYLKAVIDGINNEFKVIKSTQHIGIFFVAHKTGQPTIEFYSEPALPKAESDKVVNKLLALKHINTKYIDFPFLYTLNTKQGDVSTFFKTFETPQDKRGKRYVEGSIQDKDKILREWAATEVLPILSAAGAKVEDKFAGVKHFSELIQKTNFVTAQNLDKIINKNPDYWRATLEMSIGNQAIVTNKIFALVAQGKHDYALKYLEIATYFASEKTLANRYLKDLKIQLQVFNKQVKTEIEKGIAEHDKDNFEKAMTIYKSVLVQYPNSAWALYELYFSENAMEQKNGTREKTDRSDWDKAKIAIYAANPLYHLDVRANNGEQAYLLFRRNSIDNLFRKKDDTLLDVYEFADIAMDLGVYDFAAQLFWYSTTFDAKNKKALPRFLYCMEKLGVKNLKENFKGNHEKDFKKIEEEKDREMKNSPFYKTMKK